MRHHGTFMLLLATLLLTTPLYAQTTYVVDPSGFEDYVTIQGCIDQATDGDTCQVNAGTYAENINFSGKNITVVSSTGADHTIIDGQALDNVVSFRNGESSDAVIDGFTVRNGASSAPESIFMAAGILCINASPTIQNCTVTENEGPFWGGGILIVLTRGDFAPTVTHCHIAGNVCSGNGGGVTLMVLGGTRSPTVADTTITGNVSWNGGGILCMALRDAPSPDITRCTISANTATTVQAPGMDTQAMGGGILCVGGSPVITSCKIIDNPCFGHGGYGGGVAAIHSSPLLTNCLITGNEVAGMTSATGGGIVVAGGMPIITNCTIADNEAHEAQITRGSGIVSDSSLVWVFNSILWGNAYNQVSGPVLAAYSDVQWFYPGSTNIHADPEFVSGPGGDYYLSQTAAGQGTDSPGLNAGHPATPDWGWSSTTTRTDHQADTGTVDLGYHY